ncbi:hypothetical protein BGY98DRAFT_963449, partial [Russula aff. rugulosa BPL654]
SREVLKILPIVVLSRGRLRDQLRWQRLSHKGNSVATLPGQRLELSDCIDSPQKVRGQPRWSTARLQVLDGWGCPLGRPVTGWDETN